MNSIARSARRLVHAGVATAALAFVAPPAQAEPVIAFDMRLTSMAAAASNVSMPLVSDPGNGLGDSINGYGFLNTNVSITVSIGPNSPPSTGRTTALPAVNGVNAQGQAGKTYQVDSFFDVFFDISFTDIDPRPGRNFFGQSDGVTIGSGNEGPLRISSGYTAVLDPALPNLGLLPPPESAPYVGFGSIEIFSGVDINGNGETDTVKLTLFSLAVGDQNRTFITTPDGTVIWSFDAALQIAGSVADASVDPPFSFALTGPTTATSRLLDGEPTGVPEPTTAALLAVGIVAASVARSSRRRKGSAG